MIVLTAGQRTMATSRPDLVEGVDFICYEQVPLGPRDLINDGNGRWIDRRTTDGNVLAVDGRNARNG